MVASATTDDVAKTDGRVAKSGQCILPISSLLMFSEGQDKRVAVSGIHGRMGSRLVPSMIPTPMCAGFGRTLAHRVHNSL